MALPAPSQGSVALITGVSSGIPGGPHVKASFAPSRVMPSTISLAVTKRLMRT